MGRYPQWITALQTKFDLEPIRKLGAHTSCGHIFRHTSLIFLAGRQPACGKLPRLTKNLSRNPHTPRACLKNGRMPSGERFFCWARQKIAGILCVLQDFLTRHSGKISVDWTFCHFSNRP